MKILKTSAICLLALGLFTACSDSEGSSGGVAPEGSLPVTKADPTSQSPSSTGSAANTGKHLNINVLIDLSNRIDPRRNRLNPSQIERDKAIIKVFCEAIKNNVNANGSFKAKARMKVFFHPQPQNDAIAQTAQKLTAVFRSSTSPEAVKENKKLFAALDSNFTSGLRNLYNFALLDNRFPGSNIWRFMKEDVKNQCIESGSEFRNILVILSDGYMYYSNDLARESNRYSYIERNYDHFRRFRNSRVLKEEFDEQNFGFITANSQLENLEVILMEVAPDREFPQDFDIISRYWSKWFSEMGIKHFKICKTELPVNSVPLITNFLKASSN